MGWFVKAEVVFCFICRLISEFGFLVMATIFLPTKVAIAIFLVWVLYQFSSYHLMKVKRRLETQIEMEKFPHAIQGLELAIQKKEEEEDK